MTQDDIERRIVKLEEGQAWLQKVLIAVVIAFVVSIVLIKTGVKI